MKKYTFPKEERLCSKKQIESLFAKGKAVKQFPLTLIYTESAQELASWPSILISVSKRKFKRANKRNRIKRQIREIYRLNKHMFFNGQEKLMIAILYQSNELYEFDFLQKKLILALQRLKDISLPEKTPDQELSE